MHSTLALNTAARFLSMSLESEVEFLALGSTDPTLYSPQRGPIVGPIVRRKVLLAISRTHAKIDSQ